MRRGWLEDWAYDAFVSRLDDVPGVIQALQEIARRLVEIDRREIDEDGKMIYVAAGLREAAGVLIANMPNVASPSYVWAAFMARAKAEDQARDA